jgi:cytochrome o ubiquinol oxidase subunit II
VIKLRHVFYATLYAGLALLLSGCQLDLLNPKGLIAAQEKDILIISVLLMLIIVIPVTVLTLVFAWRYRASNTKATYSPNWAHSTLLEVIWWSIPCIIIAILGTITWISTHKLDPYKPLTGYDDETITIQAIALEWKWLFIYPDHNIASTNFIQIPVNTPVKFLITSEGPMNSFLIPQLAGQIYAMAGMQTQLHLIANTPGEYRGISANYSGRGFADMKFTVKAASKEQFAAWVDSVKQSPEPLTMLAYQQLMRPSERHPVKYYSSVHQNLFHVVVMKSMMPVKDIENLQQEKQLA